MLDSRHCSLFEAYLGVEKGQEWIKPSKLPLDSMIRETQPE